MKHYKIPSTGAVFTLPESWHEVTLDKYLALAALKERNALRVLEVLVWNADELQELEAGTLAALYNRVAFLDGLAGVVNLPVPRKLAGIKRPKRVGEMPAGQVSGTEEWANELIRKGAEDNLFAWFLPAIAFYLTPRHETLPAIAKIYTMKARSLPCTEAAPLAFWLYKGYQNSLPVEPDKFLSEITPEAKPLTGKEKPKNVSRSIFK